MPFDVTWTLHSDAAFVTGGGYKYRQLGEGNCFLRVPPDRRRMRPVLTGWFAEFDALESPGAAGRVAYGEGAAAFAGATYDPTSNYRAAAVFAFHEAQRPDTGPGCATSAGVRWACSRRPSNGSTCARDVAHVEPVPDSDRRCGLPGDSRPDTFSCRRAGNCARAACTSTPAATSCGWGRRRTSATISSEEAVTALGEIERDERDGVE